MTTDICPWLGIESDSEVRHAQPSPAHVCYAQKRAADIELDYQTVFCFTDEHSTCRFYREPQKPAVPAPAGPETPEARSDPARRRFSLVRPVLLAFGVLLAAGALVAVALFVRGLLAQGPSEPPVQVLLAQASPSPSATETSIPASPTPIAELLEPTATLTPYPGGTIYDLSPAADMAGWVASDETGGNHLGDSYLYTGVYDGVVYHGILQFDLSAVPRGATIYYGALNLTGLDSRRVGNDGAWEVRILAGDVDQSWDLASYQQLHDARVQWTVPPALAASDLVTGKANVFDLSRQMLDDLEHRLLDGHKTVSIRLDGPVDGANNVFAWDTGYGAASQGNRPRLLLGVGAAPKTPQATATRVPATNTATLTAAPPTATSTKAALPTRTSTPVAVTAIPTVGPAAGSGTPVWVPVDMLTATPVSEPPAPALPAALVGKILFQSTRAGNAGPWVMAADGSGVGLLTAAWPYEVASGREALSPDGKSLVYVSTFDGQPAVLVRPVQGGQGRPVAVFPQGQATSPVWSPQGDYIAFVGWSVGGVQIWLTRPNGTGTRALTQASWGSASHPTFSPDGTRLAYSNAASDGRRQVWVIALDGTGRRNLSNNSFDEWDPAWVK